MSFLLPSPINIIVQFCSSFLLFTFDNGATNCMCLVSVIAPFSSIFHFLGRMSNDDVVEIEEVWAGCFGIRTGVPSFFRTSSSMLRLLILLQQYQK
ncbi:hypothetical protein K431DRAFT_111466 [Polychaeton citri CBS 116435]|uniref:Uncharacterized protein n=1 Tax=Polychaeton citri CBS 116435 TaxID=1314669 RepID=A0A9P4UNI0_9PEZI|nr:hypothetical protein K431DRAFT_111466 [Polychaeton citri CBS 116435]